MYNKSIPYNDLPDLPPDYVVSELVFKKLLKASRSLAQFNGAITNLPNPNLFIDTIHLQEAKGSSEIENIVTTNDQVYQSFVSEQKYKNGNEKEVISYKKALFHGLETLKTRSFLHTDLYVELMQIIKQNNSGIRNTPGTFLAGSGGKPVYTPPTGEVVIREKLASLDRFINENENYDPLVKLAMIHYQFEAIHPFTDGNGRTGRIIMLLYLKMTGLLQLPALYLSEYIINHKAGYYKKLNDVTENKEWESWIIYVLEMIDYASIKGLKRLVTITTVMNETANKIKETLPKIYSKELVEVLFHLPYTKRQALIDAQLGTAKTVGNYLKELEKKGFLTSHKVGKEVLYLNKGLMDVLNQS
jgi:Fic family protein